MQLFMHVTFLEKAKMCIRDRAAGDLSVLPALRGQIDAERSKRQAAKAEAEARLKRAEALEILSLIHICA